MAKEQAIDPELGAMIPYYPSNTYIKKNQAPAYLPQTDLIALANAQRKAEQAGVLSPEVAKYMLANAMVEGRFSTRDQGGNTWTGDFGVRGGNAFHGLNPNVKKIITALGLQDSTKPPDPELEQKIAMATGSPARKFNKTDVVITPSGDVNMNATYATAILGIKAGESKTPEEAIARWNGVGKGAANHLKKVLEAQDMLAHPRNRAVLELYQRALMSPEKKIF